MDFPRTIPDLVTFVTNNNAEQKLEREQLNARNEIVSAVQMFSLAVLVLVIGWSVVFTSMVPTGIGLFMAVSASIAATFLTLSAARWISVTKRDLGHDFGRNFRAAIAQFVNQNRVPFAVSMLILVAFFGISQFS